VGDAQVRTPWWQLARTPRQGFVVAGVWAALAAASWGVMSGGHVTTWRVVVAVGWTLLAAANAVSAAVVLRSRARPPGPQAGAPLDR
jgi:hypothetical protein